MHGLVLFWLLVSSPSSAVSDAAPNAASVEVERPAAPDAATPMAADLATSLQPAALAELVEEILERDPHLARARHAAVAAEAGAVQARALPDPQVDLKVFALPPETRAGPQRFQASYSQRFPWAGKLSARQQAALAQAAQRHAEVETLRLDRITEARRLFYELAFVDAQEEILRSERRTLERFEEAARARYTTGTGLQQGVVRIQAQITRVDERMLTAAERRAQLRAALNALRDRPADAPLPAAILPQPRPLSLDLEALRATAEAARPELAAAEAGVAHRKAEIELAELAFRPDLMLGVGYTAVGRRAGALGRANPPEDNGDDILALNGSIELPVRRRKLEAGLARAEAHLAAAEAGRRAVRNEIGAAIGDLGARLPLLHDHWRLLDTVLRIQAREALRSAESAYSTGKLNAVDLLDAEVVLLEVELAVQRTRTDHAVALARLERAVGRALSAEPQEAEDD